MFGLGKLFGSGVGEAVQGIGNVIDQFVETDDEKRIAQQIKDRMLMQPNLAQIELNKIEASHRSIFVAGWRPFIGWVSGFALSWHFIFYDLLNWLLIVFGKEIKAPELAGTADLMMIVLSLLGLGGLRTYEKFKDKTR